MTVTMHNQYEINKNQKQYYIIKKYVRPNDVRREKYKLTPSIDNKTKRILNPPEGFWDMIIR